MEFNYVELHCYCKYRNNGNNTVLIRGNDCCPVLKKSCFGKSSTLIPQRISHPFKGDSLKKKKKKF